MVSCKKILFLGKEIESPLLFLAPMAGYTESPFRRMIRSIEPSVILVSELLSVEAIRRRSPRTMHMMDFHPSEKHYYGVQIFGNDPESFTESAKIIEDLGADFIDINLGCPSPKVVGSGYGSALLKDPTSTTNLIATLVKSSSLPVTVKMRLGFYDDKDLIQTAKQFESAGISSLAIHGRTTLQKFKGEAVWEKIYTVAENLTIPVIGNGDITTAKIAKNRLKNLSGIMIGRAALKNPWIFKQSREIFSDTPVSPLPELQEQLEFFLEQANLSIEWKGEMMAMRELRKHFAHFLRGFHQASSFRDRLIRIESMSELKEIFAEISTIDN